MVITETHIYISKELVKVRNIFVPTINIKTGLIIHEFWGFRLMSLDMILYMEKVSNHDTIVNMVRSVTRIENYERSLRKV